jgi:hypothetical protein
MQEMAAGPGAARPNYARLFLLLREAACGSIIPLLPPPLFERHDVG